MIALAENIPNPVDELREFGFGADASVAEALRIVLAGYLARIGQPNDDEAIMRLDSKALECSKVLETEAARWPAHPLHNPSTAPLHAALTAMSALYAMRASLLDRNAAADRIERLWDAAEDSLKRAVPYRKRLATMLARGAHR